MFYLFSMLIACQFGDSPGPQPTDFRLRFVSMDTDEVRTRRLALYTDGTCGDVVGACTYQVVGSELSLVQVGSENLADLSFSGEWDGRCYRGTFTFALSDMGEGAFCPASP